MPDPRSDWTAGAPKWAAVGVLGAASMGCFFYAAAKEQSPWRVIPISAHAAAAPAGGSDESAASGLKEPTKPAPAVPQVRRTININTATAAELELLPGVGPAIAARIVEHRTTYGPFKRVSDLDAVKGIGAKMIDKFRAVASVD